MNKVYHLSSTHVWELCPTHGFCDDSTIPNSHMWEKTLRKIGVFVQKFHKNVTISDVEKFYLTHESFSPKKTFVPADKSTNWHIGNEKLHRLDGPAIIWSDGTKYWYQNNKFHRDNGPAVIKADGIQRWYQNGKLHRVDGPAIIDFNGDEYWYVNGVLHREDGPAVITLNGENFWYFNGELVEKGSKK